LLANLALKLLPIDTCDVVGHLLHLLLALDPALEALVVDQAD